MTNASKLRIAGIVAGATIATVRTVGNYRRHSGHDAHSKNCSCFNDCINCVADAALNG